MYPSPKGKSAYEKQTGKEPNTSKKLAINPFRYNLEPQAMKLDKTDFESGQDSTILVREQSRRTKLEGALKKRKGVLLELSNHAFTFRPAGKKQLTIISKRDIGNTAKLALKPCRSRETRQQNKINDMRTKWQLQAISQTLLISQ